LNAQSVVNEQRLYGGPDGFFVSSSNVKHGMDGTQQEKSVSYQNSLQKNDASNESINESTPSQWFYVVVLFGILFSFLYCIR